MDRADERTRMTLKFPHVYSSPTELVGRTPLVRLGRLFPDATVLGKLEYFNPAASIKDRTALSIVRDAEADGRLKPGGTILEASSGNTGIALAWIGAALGYQVIICMPDDVSHERRALLRALGAELVLTPGPDAMAGANQEAGRILERTPGAFLSGQGGNAANPAVHHATTGPEIWEDTGGQVDVLVSAVGTGGTITGAGSYLRSKNPNLKVYAVEPHEAPVLSGGLFSPHKIQGIIGGNGFPPVLDQALYDEVISIPGDLAIETARELIRVEGLLAGVSAGANLAAARIVAARPEHAGQVIVTFLCDTAERYVSSELFDHVREA
jgi:cysteine synthase A